MFETNKKEDGFIQHCELRKWIKVDPPASTIVGTTLQIFEATAHMHLLALQKTLFMMEGPKKSKFSKWGLRLWIHAWKGIKSPDKELPKSES